MRDAPRQTAQRVEFQGLGIRHYRPIVLQKHPRLALLAVFQDLEAGDHFGPAVWRGKGRSALFAAAAETVQASGEFGAVIIDVVNLLQSDGARGIQQPAYGAVEHPGALIPVYDQNTGLHILHDLLVEALKTVQIARSFAGYGLGPAEPQHSQLHNARHDKAQQTQQTRGEQRSQIRLFDGHQVQGVGQYSEYGERGDQGGDGAVFDQNGA